MGEPCFGLHTRSKDRDVGEQSFDEHRPHAGHAKDHVRGGHDHAEAKADKPLQQLFGPLARLANLFSRRRGCHFAKVQNYAQVPRTVRVVHTPRSALQKPNIIVPNVMTLTNFGYWESQTSRKIFWDGHAG